MNNANILVDLQFKKERKLKLYKVILLTVVVFMSACSSITINPNSSATVNSEPSYEERKSFFWWGLSGEHRVDVKKVCEKSEAQQMQTQLTFTDGLLTFITLGIYSPHSVKVWCK